jgi:hypothetical protein
VELLRLDGNKRRIYDRFQEARETKPRAEHDARELRRAARRSPPEPLS